MFTKFIFFQTSFTLITCTISQGYDDIGYNFLIGGDGTIYEGRGWGKKASHTYCYNQWGYGIVFIGRYLITMPDDVMMQAYESFIQVSRAQKCLGGCK